MARPKELTKADKFFLDSHVNNNLEEDLPELAEAVKNTQEVVKEYIEGRRVILKTKVDMITKSGNGRENVVAIMTPQASTACDDARKANRTSKAMDPSIVHNCRPRK